MTGSASLLLRLAGVAAAGAVLAGCAAGSSSSAAPPVSSATTSVSAASAPSSAASTAAPASAPSTPASSAPASSGSSAHAVAPPTSAGGAPGCATRDLQVRAGVSQGAAGSVYQVLVFTNIGNTACTLYGYPGVSLAAGTPVTQVGQAATRSPIAPPTLVTLQPGQPGNALLRITQALNYPTQTCSPTATAYLQIYPPNQTTPIYLAYTATGCASTKVKLLTIGVVQAGAGSSNG
jgi:Domain of unknown function (DUF4232)